MQASALRMISHSQSHCKQGCWSLQILPRLILGHETCSYVLANNSKLPDAKTLGALSLNNQLVRLTAGSSGKTWCGSIYLGLTQGSVLSAASALDVDNQCARM